jgi:hypothetical protein
MFLDGDTRVRIPARSAGISGNRFSISSSSASAAPIGAALKGEVVESKGRE